MLLQEGVVLLSLHNHVSLLLLQLLLQEVDQIVITLIYRIKWSTLRKGHVSIVVRTLHSLVPWSETVGHVGCALGTLYLV